MNRSGVGVSLYLPREMLAELQAEAVRQERSLSWVIARMWRQRKRELAK